MAIRSKEYCDICEKTHGEGHLAAEIDKEPGRPGFPQLSWCFFRKGARLLQKASGEPVIQQGWMGQVNRVEFCQRHGDLFNVLLKAFTAGDSRLSSLLEELASEDEQSWSERNAKVDQEFATLKEKWDRDHGNGEHL